MTKRRGYQVEPRLRVRDRIALVLLLFGGFALLVGWIVGAALLWTSNRWTTRQKLLGSLIWPFGYVPAYLIAIWPSNVCSGPKGTPEAPALDVCVGLDVPLWLSLPALTLLILPPVLTTTHLIRTAHPAPRHLTFRPGEKPGTA